MLLALNKTKQNYSITQDIALVLTLFHGQWQQCLTWFEMWTIDLVALKQQF